MLGVVCLIGGAVFEPLVLSADRLPAKSIYFYNPESNVHSFAAMKTMMDRYLGKISSYSFQPFSDPDTFENMLGHQNHCIVILSSWHFQKLVSKLALKPELVGVVEGKTIQERILVSKIDGDVTSLERFSVASAYSQAYSESLLARLLPPRQETGEVQFQILFVPKEIDALMAVGFGLAQAALTSRTSLEMLGTINPRMNASLSVAAVSYKSLLPLVAVLSHDGTFSKDAVALFEQMTDSREGRQCIDIMGVDRWKKLDPSDRAFLEHRNNRN